MKQATFAVILAIASIGSAVASPMSDAAQIHFSAIGAGDTSVIMRGYADNAQLTWVGGPLDGMYAGSDAIRATWEKFGKAVGPARVTVLALEESANPKGATIVAKVQFEGKAQVNVRYVLTYRDGKLVADRLPASVTRTVRLNTGVVSKSTAAVLATVIWPVPTFPRPVRAGPPPRSSAARPAAL